MRTGNRRAGFIVHVGDSRSAGFWCIIRDTDGTPHFAYGRSFLSYPDAPKIGHEVEFTLLPPADRGELDRATEVTVVRRAYRDGGVIEVQRHTGATRLVLKSTRGQELALGELQN